MSVAIKYPDIHYAIYEYKTGFCCVVRCSDDSERNTLNLAAAVDSIFRLDKTVKRNNIMVYRSCSMCLPPWHPINLKELLKGKA